MTCGENKKKIREKSNDVQIEKLEEIVKIEDCELIYKLETEANIIDHRDIF